MLYKKSQNLEDLILWMQTEHDGVSIQDIMNKYSVSNRTAIRMKDAVKERFPNIIETKNKYKRWTIPDSTNNKQVYYSKNEVIALQTAINSLEKKMPEQSIVLNGLLNKIKLSIGEEQLKHMEPDIDALMESGGYVFRVGPKISVNKNYLEKLRFAIIACKRVKIKYNSAHNKDWREVWPYGFLYGNKHYLIAWEPTKNTMCYFDLNKIQKIEVLNIYFRRDPEFSLQKFSSQAFGIYQEEPFDVEWLFDKEVAPSASQYVFHPNQKITKNSDGTLTVKFRAGGAREMDWHLYTWGNHVKVIKPIDFDKRRKEWK